MRYLAQYSVHWVEHGAFIPLTRDSLQEHRFNRDTDAGAIEYARQYQQKLRRGTDTIDAREILGVRLRGLYRTKRVPIVRIKLVNN